MYTEEEAKKKWCPMVRVNRGGLFNRAIQMLNRIFGSTEHAAGLPQYHNCIASECMMWKWAEMWIPVCSNCKYAGVRARRGFCGLAGKP